MSASSGPFGELPSMVSFGKGEDEALSIANQRNSNTYCLPQFTQPGLAETTRQDRKKGEHNYIPSIYIIANQAVWNYPSYAAFAPLQDLTVPFNDPDYSVSNTRMLEIQGIYPRFYYRYKKAAIYIRYWINSINDIYSSFEYKNEATQEHTAWHDRVSLTTHMPNFDDDWPIPAYLTWYKSDNTKTFHALNKQLHDRAQTAPDRTSREKAESFAYKASINIQQSIQQWEYTATCLFISRNSPFPKSLWLHQFLNNPNSFGNELHQGDYTAQRQHFDNACHFEDEDNQEDDLPGTLTTALIEQSLETITSKPNANTHYTSICSNTTKRYPGGYWRGYDDENEQSHIKQEESIQDST
jgi:hypothetical protein